MFSQRILIGRGLKPQLVMSCFLFRCSILRVLSQKVGAYGSEVPPVPFPNTVVKLTRVENTWRATAREDRSVPALYYSASVLLAEFLYSSVA